MNGKSQKNQRTWYALRGFETRDITSRKYKQRHGQELSRGKAREISSGFIQAREYFRNASEADLTVRPLLQYYGVTSLSRGLTLFLDSGKREASLAQSHGLKIFNWTQDLSGGLPGIASLRMRLERGTFHDLLTATGNKFYLRHSTSAVSATMSGSIPAFDSEFSLGEIAARVPELSRQYEVCTGRSFPFFPIKALVTDVDTDTFRIEVRENLADKVEEVFPNDSFPNVTIDTKGRDVHVICPRDLLFLAQGVGPFGTGDIVIYPPLKSGLYFTPLAACFMLSFALSMLCRYFPTTWINLGRSESGDAFYPFATSLLDWIQDTFPAMTADILQGPYDFEKEPG